jgi:hypothetical protein
VADRPPRPRASFPDGDRAGSVRFHSLRSCTVLNGLRIP